MIHYYIWKNSNPQLEETLRRANEERSAAFYAALGSFWKGAAAGLAALARFAERAQRAARERQAIRELNALDDRTLSDIGVPRGAITGIVKALADGVEEPRPVTAVRKQAMPTQLSAAFPTVKAPAWLNGVVEGGRAVAANSSPVRRPMKPGEPSIEQIARKAEAGCG